MRSPFPPIADYAFLSDCEVGALVSPSGNVEWMCVPRPDSPSIFGAILDRGGGGFRIGPVNASVPASRRYIPGTLVVETTWMTSTGWLEVRDALCMAEWYDRKQRSPEYRRAPSDYQAEHIFLRTARCTNGKVDVSLHCAPRPGYGVEHPRWAYGDRGYGHAVAEAGDERPELHLTTGMRLGIEDGEATARSTLHEGDAVFAALSWGTRPAPSEFEDADRRTEETMAFWRDWLGEGSFPDHPWRTHLQRGALTLKGLTYAPTGALLAAPTTSLPETPGGERNWDYRYSWIRDSSFTLWGLYSLGLIAEADDFMYFVADVCERHPVLQVMYGVGGERELPERTLDHLAGYEDARPVRVGNDAYRQAQHDLWGTVLDSVYLHTKSRVELPERLWPMLRKQVEAALERWRHPDRGIWEVRGEPRHFTSSKLFCWVAADRGARLATMHEDHDLAARWRGAAEEIHAEICEKGVDDRGVFTQSYGSTALDASLLLMPLVRFLPPDDPRIRATVLAIADELGSDGFVLRYRVEETDDGMTGREGAFVICSFWLVSALSEIGETARARRSCERLLGVASELGLFAEQVDAATGRHLGNFPQAFSHLALINAVLHVIRSDLDREPGEFEMPGRGSLDG